MHRRRSVHVPELRPRLSSSRVLTMEFIDGARVTDGPALAKMGADRSALAALVAETFNEMIFIHGDVHCDPHAANMVGGREGLRCWGQAERASGAESCARARAPRAAPPTQTHSTLSTPRVRLALETCAAGAQGEWQAAAGAA